MITYKVKPYKLSYLHELGELGYILSSITEDDNGKIMIFYKEVKNRKEKLAPIASSDFDQFYNKYPNKKARKDAMVMWTRLKESERELAFDGLERYLIYWKKKGIEKDFIPMPATWLNGRRWEDNLSDTVIIAPNENIEKIRAEELEERKNEQEKRAMNKRIADIKANPELWERLSNKALELMTEEQKSDRNSIVFKSIFDARIRTIINQ